MAGLQQRNDRYPVIFRYHGKQRTLNLGKVSEGGGRDKIGSGRLPPHVL